MKATNISKTTYKNIEAVAVENETLKALFLPMGGKLVSLTDKLSKREFFFQNPGSQYALPYYDGDFCQAECSGFDDMFPNNSPAFVDQYPWNESRLPDHGEVASLPWNIEASPDSLHMHVFGVRLPYKFSKEIRISENVVRIRYCAENLSSYELPCLYASHPMINTEEGGCILVPFRDRAPMVCCAADDSAFGYVGMNAEWPNVLRADSYRENTGTTPKPDQIQGTYKFYFSDTVPKGECGYQYVDGTKLIFSFSEKMLPYLGIWINNGFFHNSQNIVLAMSSCYLECQEFAKVHGRNNCIEPFQSQTWDISISVVREAGV